MLLDSVDTLRHALDCERGLRAFPGWTFDSERDEWSFPVDGFVDVVVRRDNAGQWSIPAHPLLLWRASTTTSALAGIVKVRDLLGTDEVAAAHVCAS